MRYLMVALLFLAPLASAQVQFSSTAGGVYVPLDGATAQGSVNIRLAGCAAGPWQFAIDGVVANTENTCPYALQGDDTLFDTKTLTNGAHTLTAKGPTSTLTAQFTVSNAGPGIPTGPTWTGSQGLSWTPPTLNDDGSTLTDLAGYLIQFGNTATLTSQVRVENPGATSYVVPGLAQGRWYFGIRAYNEAGAQSDLSTIVQAQITESVPACPAQPAPESQFVVCPTGTTGNWTQARTYTAAQYPTCWTLSEWLPASAPAGTCVAVPAPLVTAGPLSYFTAGTAAAPIMSAVGLIAAGLPCGPEMKTVAGVKFCRISRGQTDFVNWPSKLDATDIWARAAQ